MLWRYVYIFHMDIIYDYPPQKICCQQGLYQKIASKQLYADYTKISGLFIGLVRYISSYQTYTSGIYPKGTR